MLHYYGVIEAQELLNLVRTHLKLEITGQEFEQIIERGFKGYRNKLFSERNELFFFHVEVDDIGEFLKDQASNQPISFRPVAEKDVQEINRFMLKTTRDRYTKRIVKFLSQSGVLPEEIAEYLYNTIVDYNNGVECLELLKEFFREVEFKSEKELNTFADNLTQFLNKTPLWEFKGWTSEEMEKQCEQQEHQNQKDLNRLSLRLIRTTANRNLLFPGMNQLLSRKSAVTNPAPVAVARSIKSAVEITKAPAMKYYRLLNLDRVKKCPLSKAQN